MNEPWKREYEQGGFVKLERQLNDVLTGADGENVDMLHPYGIGIDVHSRFIQVCLIIKIDGEMQLFEQEFPTSWDSLLETKKWLIKIIVTKGNGRIRAHPLRYTLESTST